MLTGLRDRVRDGRGMPEPAWPDTDGQQLIVLARRDPDSRTISLILDATTANIAMHGIAVHAGDREAHVREVERYGQNLPEDSYGRRNRQAIAARETRSPPGCEPWNGPTGQRSTPTLRPGSIPLRLPVPLTWHPTTTSSWSRTLRPAGTNNGR
jgi:hypothetical protein